jgi:hypothetical protein
LGPRLQPSEHLSSWLAPLWSTGKDHYYYYYNYHHYHYYYYYHHHYYYYYPIRPPLMPLRGIGIYHGFYNTLGKFVHALEN